MWEKLSNSFLFSKNYYKTDSNFCNTPFIHRQQQYSQRIS